MSKKFEYVVHHVQGHLQQKITREALDFWGDDGFELKFVTNYPKDSVTLIFEREIESSPTYHPFVSAGVVGGTEDE